MKEEYEMKLKKDFPKLYRTMYPEKLSKPFHCIEAFGCECGNGWFDLIYDLSKNISKLIDELPLGQQEHCHVDQIKEKFGGLRFYMRSSTDEMEKLIAQAEDLSYKTCEVCGKPGQLRDDSYWYSTRCDECFEK